MAVIANERRIREKCGIGDAPWKIVATWPIDNNLCENAIRPFAIGRRNWMFADSVAGANASANLYSLVETSKASGIDPYAYLIAIFRKLPAAQTADDFEALLPWRLIPGS